MIPGGPSSGPERSASPPPGVLPDVRVVLIGKPGCHLCETARDVVATVAGELGVEWREVSLLDHPALAERYAEQIPVVVVDGREHEYWRVDERRLRKALRGRRWWRPSIRE